MSQKFNFHYTSLDGRQCILELKTRDPRSNVITKINLLTAQDDIANNMPIIFDLVMNKMVYGNYSYEAENKQLTKQHPDKLFQSFGIKTKNGTDKLVNMKFPNYKEAVKLMCICMDDKTRYSVKLTESKKHLYVKNVNGEKYDDEYFDDIDLVDLNTKTCNFLLTLLNFDGFFSSVIDVLGYYIKKWHDAITNDANKGTINGHYKFNR